MLAAISRLISNSRALPFGLIPLFYRVFIPERISIKKFYELQNSSCPHLNSGKLIADFSEAAMDVVALRYGQVRNIVNRHQ